MATQEEFTARIAELTGLVSQYSGFELGNFEFRFTGGTPIRQADDHRRGGEYMSDEARELLVRARTMNPTVRFEDFWASPPENHEVIEVHIFDLQSAQSGRGSAYEFEAQLVVAQDRVGLALEGLGQWGTIEDPRLEAPVVF